MKKILFSAAMIMAAVTSYAQQDLNTAADAVRYSLDNLTGTARFRAMGGAFGAVGGDPSAINVNPAGSAIFMYNTGTATLSSYNMNNQANYFGTNRKQNDNTFDLNQIGGFFVFNNAKEDAFMNKFTLGFNYENTQTFENIVGISGVNPTGSIVDYFLNYANNSGVTLGTLQNEYFENLSFAEQQAYLGYNAYAINPVNNNAGNTAYTTNDPDNGNRYQDSYIATTGFNGKVALNFAAQLAKRFYLGANLNVHFSDYINNTSFYEDTNNGTNAGLQELQFNTRRYTYGGGFSLNVGAIAKITESFRLGAAYESPTWMRLQDEINQNITGVSSGVRYYTNPGVTMVGDDYTIKTPAKYTGSAAFIIGKKGLISVDYAMRNYANTKYTGNRYSVLNDQLSQTLDWAGELRVGTEWRVKQLSLRAGYRFQQSPYKNGTTVGDLSNINGGLGYSFGGSRIDLTYSWAQRKSDVSTFTPGFTDAARVKTTYNNVVLSYTIDL
ncbi:OmpP1/FadL family transporter [Flavobacterium psychrotrophum]|uniref:OmpP1/FadL family transporter n=1 Tax=Flavobacterium psychrotrophum TaxID=2294119 RepID=UPI000E3127CE|nr:transporter [Flavobacterium psychrotrophum]